MNSERLSPFAPLSRRQCLQLALAGGSAAVLAGCGFHLRQAPQFAFSTIHLGTAANSPIGLSLRRVESMAYADMDWQSLDEILGNEEEKPADETDASRFDPDRSVSKYEVARAWFKVQQMLK